MQHRPVLGAVDLRSREHLIDEMLQPGLIGQLEQQPHGLVGDAVLGIIEEQIVEPQ